jgi:dihydrofolate reductase
VSRPRVVLVAAVARNGVIGHKGALPWGHFPEDMEHFRKLTMGAAVVMGWRTWESLPAQHRPLPGRRNVVLTRTEAHAAAAAECGAQELAPSLEFAIARLTHLREPVIYVIGGAQVYALALHVADEVVLTEIDRDFDGDTKLPYFSRWRFRQERGAVRRAAAGFKFAINTYRRIRRHWSDDVEWRPGRWDALSSAPQDCTYVRGRAADGKLLEPMHYACGGGEEQPSFDGWFLPYSDGSGFYQVRPVSWQPLRALPDGPDCASCPKLPAECCRKGEA